LLPATAGWSKGILLGIDDITERTGAQEALRAARAKLALHADQLEKLVTKRTAQLTATNLRLEASSESNRRGKEEYRVLLTDSLLMQKKLRDLTHQIISAQEEERKEISRELHDEVVQTLIGINVELSALGQGAEMTNPRLKARIARTQTFVAASVNAVHRFARGLRPAVLDDLGLIPALTAFCKQLAEQKQIKIQITAFSGIETMSGAGKTALYRVAQEALTNVARHAQAALVKVGIREVDDRVRMEIADDGQSFAVEKVLGARNPKRLGLVGMKERVEMLGGSLTIDSVQGRGTTVRAEIPFVLERRRK